MGTRSSISLKLESGKIKTVYCHWDGYLSNNGVLLYENYTTYEKVDALLELGDISSLRKTIKCPAGHSHDSPADDCTVFYGRDRGEKDVEFDIVDNFESVDKQEYNYLFKDGIWYVEYTKYENDDCYNPKDVFERLEDALTNDDDSEFKIVDYPNVGKAHTCYAEYICVDNKGISDNFDLNEIYSSARGHKESDMLYIYDKHGTERECFADRFKENLNDPVLKSLFTC